MADYKDHLMVAEINILKRLKSLCRVTANGIERYKGLRNNYGAAHHAEFNAEIERAEIQVIGWEKQIDGIVDGAKARMAAKLKEAMDESISARAEAREQAATRPAVPTGGAGEEGGQGPGGPGGEAGDREERGGGAEEGGSGGGSTQLTCPDCGDDWAPGHQCGGGDV